MGLLKPFVSGEALGHTLPCFVLPQAQGNGNQHPPGTLFLSAPCSQALLCVHARMPEGISFAAWTLRFALKWPLIWLPLR